jgi:hypothetical protein
MISQPNLHKVKFVIFKYPLTLNYNFADLIVWDFSELNPAAS